MSISLQIYNSIFTIEVLVILIALDLIKRIGKIQSFLIASDSHSLILAIKNHGTTNEIIKNFQERASSLPLRAVTFFWILKQNNIPKNDKSKEAATYNNTHKQNFYLLRTQLDAPYKKAIKHINYYTIRNSIINFTKLRIF